MLRKSDRYACPLKPNTPIDDGDQYHIVRSPIPVSQERREQLDQLSNEERLQYYFGIYDATFRLGLTPTEKVHDVDLPDMNHQERLGILCELWRMARKYKRPPHDT